MNYQNKFRRAFIMQQYPKFMIAQAQQAAIIASKIKKLEKLIGKEQAKELVNEFKNQACRGMQINSVYISRRIDQYLNQYAPIIITETKDGLTAYQDGVVLPIKHTNSTGLAIDKENN